MSRERETGAERDRHKEIKKDRHTKRSKREKVRYKKFYEKGKGKQGNVVEVILYMDNNTYSEIFLVVLILIASFTSLS